MGRRLIIMQGVGLLFFDRVTDELVSKSTHESKRLHSPIGRTRPSLVTIDFEQKCSVLAIHPACKPIGHTGISHLQSRVTISLLVWSSYLV